MTLTFAVRAICPQLFLSTKRAVPSDAGSVNHVDLSVEHVVHQACFARLWRTCDNGAEERGASGRDKNGSVQARVCGQRANGETGAMPSAEGKQ